MICDIITEPVDGLDVETGDIVVFEDTQANCNSQSGRDSSSSCNILTVIFLVYLTTPHYERE